MVIKLHKKVEAFRLAAVLYADNNYEVKPKTIHRKIVESIFLDNNNQFLSIDDIINEINVNYDFLFSELEVESIIKSNKDNFIVNDAREKVSACLTFKRFEILEKKLNNKTIDFFIDEYFSLNKPIDSLEEFKGLIYRFLYLVFNSNLSSFQKLIDLDVNLESVVPDLNSNFNSSETGIINDFLKWENDLKNKSIFDISSFALEYCLITNKRSENLLEVNNLKNKNFYLDTNVIFRAIGVNGDVRKKRTLTFLDKFKEANERLVISSYTKEEFDSTLHHYITEIEKKVSPRISSKVFLEYSNQSDFYNYYYQWRSKRTNDSISLFKASIESTYEALKRKYKITELNELPYNENDPLYQDVIENLETEIYSWKRLNTVNPDRINYNSIVYDSKNIFLVDYERGGKSKNIFETKFFFISTDQLLKKWDLERDNVTPSVILPSQWMTILLRYYQRTNDDFKSFVSFLNLSQNDSLISNEKLITVLNGISEISVDMEEQSHIVKQLIENKFKDIICKESDDDEIRDNAMIFAKTALEDKVDELKNNTTNLNERIQKAENTIAELTLKNVSGEDSKNKYREILINNTMKDWKNYGKLYLFISFVLLLLCVCSLFFQNENWNLIFKLNAWINSLPPDSSQKNIAFYLMPLVLFGSLIFFARLAYFRLIDKDSVFDKRKKITERIDHDK